MISAIIEAFPPWRLFVATCVLGFLTTFTQGWHSSCINIPEQPFLDFFNSSFHSHYGYYLSSSGLQSLWAFALNITFASAIVAALLCMKMIPYTGLRNGISFWGNLGTLIGLTCFALITVTNSFELFIIGRAIIGVSVTYSNALIFILLPEASPNYARGFVSMLISVLQNFGQIAGTVVSLPTIFGVEDKFWLLLGLPIIAVVIQMTIYRLFPDSPKRLYIHIKDKEAAAKSIRFYHGNNADIQSVFNEYEEEANLVVESMSISEVIFNKSLRMPLVLTLAVNFGAYWGGTGAAYSYSEHIFEKAGASENAANIGSIAVAFIGLPAAFVSMLLIDRIGRRFFILSGFIFACICLIGMVVFPQLNGKVPEIMEIICLVVLLFVMNWGPINIATFLPAELLPFPARAVGFGLNGTLLSICLVVSSQMYGGLNEKIGSYIFIIFLVPVIFVTIFLYFKLPETMNASSKEVMEMMGDGKGEKVQPVEDGLVQEKY